MPPQQQQRDDPAPWETGQQQQQPPAQTDPAPWETSPPRAIGNYPQVPQADITTPSGAGQFGIGVLKSVPQTIHGAAAITHLAPQGVLDIVQRLATPTNPEQEIGKETGQALQFLAVPGGEGLAGAGMRIAGSGALSAMQSDQPSWKDFLIGAGGAAAGEGIARIPRAASGLAESALKIGSAQRGPNIRTGQIGEAVLRETPWWALTPAQIEQTAGGAVRNLTTQMEGNVHQATQQGAAGSTTAAHQVLTDAIQKAPRNAPDYIKDLFSLRDVLHLGQASQTAYTPDELLEMKRGIGLQVSRWPPEARMNADVTLKRLYGAIDNELDRIVPGNAELNDRINRLIPARQRAYDIQRQAGLTQGLLHKAAVHTGAATLGAVTGAAAGIPAGIAAFAVPEVLASPEARMLAARGINVANRPIPRYAIPRLATGAISAGTRYLENQNQ